MQKPPRERAKTIDKMKLKWLQIRVTSDMHRDLKKYDVDVSSAVRNFLKNVIERKARNE